jgi:hypothetical protein
VVHLDGELVDGPTEGKALEQQTPRSAVRNTGDHSITTHPRRPSIGITSAGDDGERDVRFSAQAFRQFDDVATCTSWLRWYRTDVE